MSSDDNDRLTTDEYHPRKFIEEYTNPYPKRELVEARATLIRAVCDWSQKGGAYRLKLKEKLGMPEVVDTEQVLHQLQQDHGKFIGPSTMQPTSRNRSFAPLHEYEMKASSTRTVQNSRTSTGGIGAKRGSDSSISVVDVKKPRQEQVVKPKPGAATGDNLIVVSPQKEGGPSSGSNLIVVSPEKESHLPLKRPISPLRVVEPGRSTLSISSLNSAKKSSAILDKTKAISKDVSEKHAVPVGCDSNNVAPTNTNSSAKSCAILQVTEARQESMSSIKPAETPPTPSANEASNPSKKVNSQAGASIKNSKNDNKRAVSVVSAVDIIKCDFCDHYLPLSIPDKSKMQYHLKTIGHYSASVYGAQKTGEELTTVSVKKCLFVLEHTAWFKNWIVKCPDCPTIFEDVFQCGMHYRHTHSSHIEKFGLFALIQIKSIKYTLKNFMECLVCHQKFETLKKLNKHERKANHLPIESPAAGETCCLLFIIRETNKVVVNDYNLMKTHITDYLQNVHQGRLKNHPSATSVTVLIKRLQNEKSLVKTLPPPFTQETAEIVDIDIQTCKRLVTFGKHVLGSTHKRSQKQLEELKCLKKQIKSGLGSVSFAKPPTTQEYISKYLTNE